MGVKRIETIETFEGVGPVINRKSGESLGEFRYLLEVSREIIDAAAMGNPDRELPGLKDVRGRVQKIDGDTGAALFMETDELWLTLEGGRIFEFFTRDSEPGGVVGVVGRFICNQD